MVGAAARVTPVSRLRRKGYAMSLGCSALRLGTAPRGASNREPDRDDVALSSNLPVRAAINAPN
jgi:hypothetical protein